MSKVKSRRRRLHNGNIASIHDVYCLIEIMRLYGVSESTPANWVKQGLVRVSGTASFLVRGEELNRFHAERKKRSKQPLAAHQFFCLTCHAPSEPAPGTLSGAEPDHRDIRLQGRCVICDTPMFRPYSASAAEAMRLMADSNLVKAKSAVGMSPQQSAPLRRAATDCDSEPPADSMSAGKSLAIPGRCFDTKVNGASALQLRMEFDLEAEK